MLVAGGSAGQVQRLDALLRGHGLEPTVQTGGGALDLLTEVQPEPAAPEKPAGPLWLQAGDLGGGFRLRTGWWCWPRRRSSGPRPGGHRGGACPCRASGIPPDLQVGDYVVHVAPTGWGATRAVQAHHQGVPGDFVLVEYAGKDKLYLPVYRLGRVREYVGGQAAPSSTRWAGPRGRPRRQGQGRGAQIAEELLQIYAQREAQQGHAHPEGGELYGEFEATFPYEETPDQHAAIEDVQRGPGTAAADGPADLRRRGLRQDRGGPAGRLPGGARGPPGRGAGARPPCSRSSTSTLSASAWSASRCRSEMLNRFGHRRAARRPSSSGSATARVDVVIGTHRLLGRDVRFKDLGLVVIDEEQRFGVAHKERFKKLKTQVDVLTLSATPIPRTLHMSLVGMRESSRHRHRRPSTAWPFAPSLARSDDG